MLLARAAASAASSASAVSADSSICLMLGYSLEKERRISTFIACLVGKALTGIDHCSLLWPSSGPLRNSMPCAVP